MHKEIDYQPATNLLKEVIFDVTLQPVYSEYVSKNLLFKQPISTNNYLAVVNQNSGNILSVVGKNYKLIPNKDALEMGKWLFKNLFPFVETDELIPYKVIAPNSLASVHIDLIHKNVNFKVWEQEEWLPFLRVSNSYNRNHTLSFEIGFVRKLCSNGVLFNKKTMKIKYTHSKSNKMDIVTDVGVIKANQEIFMNQCQEIREIRIPREMMFPLVCHIMNINLDIPEDNSIMQKHKRIDSLSGSVNDLVERYCNDKEPVGYDALSVVSDLVSHQDEYKNLAGYHLNTLSYYQKPATLVDWLVGLKKEDPAEIEQLLNPTIQKISKLQEYLNVKWINN